MFFAGGSCASGLGFAHGSRLVFASGFRLVCGSLAGFLFNTTETGSAATRGVGFGKRRGFFSAGEGLKASV